MIFFSFGDSVQVDTGIIPSFSSVNRAATGRLRFKTKAGMEHRNAAQSPVNRLHRSDWHDIIPVVMARFPPSMVTISKENGKLVVVRKAYVRTRSETFFSCSCPVLILVALIAMVYGLIIANAGKDEAFTFLIAVLIILVLIIPAILVMVIRDKLQGNTLPQDYHDEIITFDADRFLVQYHGMVSLFSYRLNDKPVLRLSGHEPVDVDFLIPCSPLEDYVHRDFDGGYYTMSYINITDAKLFLDAFKEHLDAIG